jgi:hypothetical protein
VDFYNIVLIQPAGYPHSMALYEIGLLLFHSLQSLGIPSDFRLNHFGDSANIVLGYHLLNDPGVVLQHPCIIYQLEQLSDREGWFNENRFEILRQAREVWDYSPENVRFLRDKGIQNVKLLPIGFHEKLQTILKADPSIDILFYGSLNPRRNAVLAALMKHCRVEVLFNVYGKERDQYISRSKIILNIHFFAAQIMEQVRISYLLNNRCFVISEDAALNPYKGLVTAPLDELVDCCRRYLQAPAEREGRAEESFALFRRQPMVDFLKEVL